MKELYGVVCATVTPMMKSGEVDERSLRRLCRHLNDNGISGLYPNGTNGEGLLLSGGERRRIAEILVEENRGRASLYIQCGAMRPEETAEHIRHAKHAGADGAGIMTPLFFGCDRAMLAAYYDEMLEAAEGLPAYIYNIPSHTRNDLAPDLFGQLLQKHQNLLGIKYSDSNLMRAQDYLRAAPRKAGVLIGCDSLFLPCLAAGGTGTVSGPAMVFSKRFTGIYKAWADGDLERARELQTRVVETDRLLADIPSFPALKAMLKMLGVIDNDTCRKPFRPLTRDEYGRLERILSDYQKETETES